MMALTLVRETNYDKDQKTTFNESQEFQIDRIHGSKFFEAQDNFHNIMTIAIGF